MKETNLAYDYSFFEDGRKEESNPIKEVKPVVQRAAKKQGAAVFKASLGMVFVICILFSFIYTRVVQTELSCEYNNAIQELNALKSENARLQVKIEEEMSNDKILQIAKAELNMQEPDSSKTEYIEFNNMPKSQVLNESTWHESLQDWFVGLFE